ncbi:hypothetical protein ALMP_45060, partial [Streptomyces sp. A012304]
MSLLTGDPGRHPGHPALTAWFADTVTLVQALSDTSRTAPLWCVTEQAVAVGDDPAAEATRAEIWGFGRAAALELPTAWGGLVDVPEDADDRVWSRLARTLAADEAEDQVALRVTGAWVPRLRRTAVAQPGPEGGWTPAGTVLITGGTGGLGAQVARWAAARGAEHLVLTARRGPHAPGADALTAELTAHGVRVTVAACDVADREALARLVADVEADGPPIRAVVHTAGIGQAATVAETDLAACAHITEGKVLGAAHLDALFGDRPLDAFVLFSSIAGVWGSGAQGAYAAGNAYLDALARHRRSRGLTATAVAWGPWAGAGMAAGESGEELARRGLRAMDPDTAVALMARAVARPEAATVLADVDWPQFLRRFTALRPSALLGDLPEARAHLAEQAAGRALPTGDGRPADEPELARRLAEATAGEGERILLDLVLREVAAVLGLPAGEAPSAERAFRDLGFDSLTAVELRDRLSLSSGLELPSTLVFDYPTPTALAGHLFDELAGARPAHSDPAHSDPAGGPVVDGEPIAIVAMACRYPGGVTGPEELWRLVADGVDAVSGFPADRGWDLDALYDPDPDRPGTSYAREGGFLDTAAEFDAALFGISPREALAMDPQQRLLLETAWEVFENAGLDPTSVKGETVGVFVGGAACGYGTGAGDLPDGVEGYALTGSVSSVLSGRVAYTFGLEGPALTVDTACSSSLVALHLAGRALQRGECSMALAGGVTVMATPTGFVEFSRQRGLSPDGRCKAFAAAADGTGWSEGVGLLLVERLSDAVRNGHRVLAVMRGSAVNQDGASNGLTAPNGPSQQRVIRQALADARLTARDVDAVEAHGTGTALGDPIEAQALLATYGRDRPDGTPLYLGSVKSNIGHTTAAAGVAGVIKTVMAMREGVLAPTLHVDAPTPHVDWSAGTVELLTAPRAWPEHGRPRRAGVSAFGISGTNAHVVLEQAPIAPAEPAGPRPAPAPGTALPFLLSAHTGRALRAQAARLVGHLADPAAWDPDDARPALTDLAYSLAVSRAGLAHRAVVTAADREGLRTALAGLAAGESGVDAVVGVAQSGARPVFVFPGQGSQWAEMAGGLLTASPAFATQILACEEALAPFVDWSLTSVLNSESDAWLERVDVVQPVLWAVMVSLAALWQAHGVRPAAVVGHSQGEIAAACVAGALSLEDGAKVVALRSKAILDLSGKGGMASVGVSVDQVAGLIAPFKRRLSVAAVNGPASVIVSGEQGALDELLAICEAQGTWARRVPVDYASHSTQVSRIRKPLLRALAGIRPQTSRIPFCSSVTGELLDTATLDAQYWYTNLRQTVRFEDAVRTLLDQGHDVFVESSAHPVLTTGVLETIEDTGADAAALGTLRRNQGGPERFLTALAEAHAHGVTVDWQPVLPSGVHRVDLPTYAFQRERYWLGDTTDAPAGPRRDRSAWAARLAGLSPQDRDQAVRDMTFAHAATVLGRTVLSTADAEQTFKDLGLDSPSAVEFRNRVNTDTGLQLPTTLAYDHPTPVAVARHLAGLLTGTADRHPDHARTAARPTTPGTARPADDDAIAIVGMACRLPGGIGSPEDLWRLVAAGGDAITPFPADRGWDLESLYDPDPDSAKAGTSYARHGGFLHGVADFDAGFFGISPREALAMDPQQRLLLETSWEAFERAGIDPAALRGSRTGVFVGAMNMDYGARLDEPAGDSEGYLLTGNTGSVVSGRLAYTFGFEGPAVTVDTACSSSLVGLHLAVQALRNGECALALAGGVTVMSTPGMFIEFSRQRGLSADGRCKAFSAAADGTGWAEGVGVLLVERLSDAVRHGHRVLATVRGTAVNQDGASNGLTAPNGPSQ